MLTIENISNLQNTNIGDWKVIEAKRAGIERWFGSEHYCITFGRGGSYGFGNVASAAVLIDRREDVINKGYRVSIVWESFDRVIREFFAYKANLADKDFFFRIVMETLNERYETTN